MSLAIILHRIASQIHHLILGKKELAASFNRLKNEPASDVH
jgi:hypothetical protein